MKIASTVVFLIVAVAAVWLFGKPDPPICGVDILAANILGCDIKGSAK